MTTPTITSRLPTKLAGYVDEGAFYALLTEAFEQVPDLMWPTSVLTYSQMRRDPQLAAVLAGFTLPIRRATWNLDATGCRPEVAALVADDMGLPLAGADDPGAARTRGVSWAEHLRAALLHLVYGHFGFELLARIDDNGQARLAGLYERMPQTISFIHSTPTGDFAGISQIGFGGRDNVPEVTADRMAWYVHDREGSAWHGTSLLRPGFAPWLLKREMQRVLATSSRRFGMGVPTVRALPGTTPTPEQMAAASTFAQQMRGGEEAGGAIPPGFVVELQGLLGGVPNTLEFIRWLDQQMSGMVLSRWMDLGNSVTGSRALGESFIDVFMLSLQAIADSVADIATRQVCARIVGWNFGDNEPVPRVTVADVGTRHEVTAEALGLLLAAGALQADPQLEEWVRRTYRLPPRDPSVPWTPPKAKTSPATASDGSAMDHMESVAASAPVRRSRRKPATAAGQLELPIASAAAQRDPTPDEAASGADFPAHQQVWQSTLDDLQQQWPTLAQPMVDDLSQQAGADAENDRLGDLGNLAVSATVVAALTAAIAAAMTLLAGKAAAHVVAEAASQGHTISAPDQPGADVIDPVAQTTAALIASGYSSAAARRAMQLGPDATADEVSAAVTAALTEMGAAGSGWVSDNLRAALSAAQMAARQAVFAAHPPKTLIASEINDTNTCSPCADVDGAHFGTLDEALKAYPMHGYVGCLGGGRCRGQLLGHW